MNTIAVLTTGQMGSSFSACIKAANPSIRLVTDASKRSPRTQQLARDGSFEDLGSLEAVLSQADVVLSVVVPDKAVELAQEVAQQAKEMGDRGERIKTRFFADLNAIAPTTVQSVAALFTESPLRVVDGGIIGGPASSTSAPLIALSGEGARELDDFLRPLFLGRTKVAGSEVGQASALKLAYASTTKGFLGLVVNATLLADEYNVLQHLEEEFAASQPHTLKVLKNLIPRNTAKAFRWVGEMEEVSKAYGDAQLPFAATVFEGLAGTQQFIADNDVLGKEPIEEALKQIQEGKRTAEDVLRMLKEGKLKGAGRA
ncbi:hypothetical protein JCM21900_000259 [Sporobolomyces salmonicolor]